MKYGMDMSSFEEQVECWMEGLRNEDFANGRYVETEVVDVEVKDSEQPVWLTAVCDDMVYGRGAADVSVYEHDDAAWGFLIQGSAVDQVMGYGVVVDEEECLGFFPFLIGHSSVADAYIQALRLVPDGSIRLYLHEIPGVRVDQLRDMGLVEFSVSGNVGAVDTSQLARVSPVDHRLTRSIYDAEYPQGYCYLRTVAVAQLFQQAIAYGLLPHAKDLLDGFDQGTIAPSDDLLSGVLSLESVNGMMHVGKVSDAVGSFTDLLDALSLHGEGVVGGKLPDVEPSLYGMIFGAGKQQDDGLSTFSGSGVETYEVSSPVKAIVPEGVCIGDDSRKTKVKCARCEFMVNPVGHQLRCRIPAVKEPGEERKALIGDALHALDVKILIAGWSSDVKAMTVRTIEYTAATAQRDYLAMVDPGACGADRSNHTWGTAFEVRYRGKFRYDYLLWLTRELGEDGEMRDDIREWLTEAQDSVVAVLTGGGTSPVLSTFGRSVSTSEASGDSVSSVASNVGIAEGGISWRRLNKDMDSVVPSLDAVETRVLSNLVLEHPKRSREEAMAYKVAARSTELSVYRRASRELLEKFAYGALPALAKAAKLRMVYVIRVLSRLACSQGVAVVKVLSVGVGYAKVSIGEYVLYLPLPKHVHVHTQDLDPIVCASCGSAHWLVGSEIVNSYGCGKDSLEAEFEVMCAEVLEGEFERLLVGY